MYWTLELASYLEDAPWPATKDELIDFSIRSIVHLLLSTNRLIFVFSLPRLVKLGLIHSNGCKSVTIGWRTAQTPMNLVVETELTSERRKRPDNGSLLAGDDDEF